MYKKKQDSHTHTRLYVRQRYEQHKFVDCIYSNQINLLFF